MGTGGCVGDKPHPQAGPGPPASCWEGRRQEQPVPRASPSAHRSSAPPTHAESEPVGEAPLKAGKTPGPQGLGGPCSASPRRRWPQGTDGRSREGLPGETARTPRTPAHTPTGLCRPQGLGCSCLPVTAAYSLEGALLPQVSSKIRMFPCAPAPSSLSFTLCPPPQDLGVNESFSSTSRQASFPGPPAGRSQMPGIRIHGEAGHDATGPPDCQRGPHVCGFWAQRGQGAGTQAAGGQGPSRAWGCPTVTPPVPPRSK